MSSSCLHLKLEKDAQTLSWDKAYWSKKYNRSNNSSTTIGGSGIKTKYASENMKSFDSMKNTKIKSDKNTEEDLTDLNNGFNFTKKRNFIISHLRFVMKYNYFLDSSFNNVQPYTKYNNLETNATNDVNTFDNLGCNFICDSTFGFLNLSVIKKITFKIEEREKFFSDFEIKKDTENEYVPYEEKNTSSYDLVFCKLAIIFGNTLSENKTIGFRLPLKTGLIWYRCLMILVNANIFYAKLEKLKIEEWLKFNYLSFVYKWPGCLSCCGCQPQGDVGCCGWCSCHCSPSLQDAIDVRPCYFNQ